MRTPSPTDFPVKVPSIGNFVFARRRFADETAIQVEYARIIDGVTPTPWLSAVGGWISTLRVLTVSAPPGWDLDELDPLEDDTYAKLKLVYDCLRDQERSFRRGSAPSSQASGEGTTEHHRV